MEVAFVASLASELAPYWPYIDTALTLAIGAVAGAIVDQIFEVPLIQRLKRFLKRRSLRRGGPIPLEVRQVITVRSEQFREPTLPNAITGYLDKGLLRAQDRFDEIARQGETLLKGVSRLDASITLTAVAETSNPRSLAQETLRMTLIAEVNSPFDRLRDFILTMRDELTRFAAVLRAPGAEVTEDLDSLSIVLHLRKEPKIVERFARLNVTHMIAKGDYYYADFSGKEVVFRGAITPRLPADLEEVLVQYY
jgi:hypothetical protein